jgi:hypothetical protein
LNHSHCNKAHEETALRPRCCRCCAN